MWRTVQCCEVLRVQSEVAERIHDKVVLVIVMNSIWLFCFLFWFTKVSSLEVICRQQEEVIKERENALGQIQSELDRQAQIAAMIHSLSSGKVTINGTT